MSEVPKTKEQGMPAVIEQFPLTPVDSGENMMDIVHENLDGDTLSPFDLERITIPAQGSTTWILEDGAEEKSIEGIVIKWQKSRSYWAESMSGEGTPPDCVSVDMIHGNYSDAEGNAKARECATCPMNVFGTGQSGASKACKETQHVFLLRQGSILPSVLQIPPSNLKGFTKYRSRLIGKKKSINGIVTEFTLQKQKSGKSGFTYSEIVFNDVGDLSSEQYQMIRQFRQELDKIIGGDGAVETVSE